MIILQILWRAVLIAFGIMVAAWVFMTVPWGVWVGFIALVVIIAVVGNATQGKAPPPDEDEVKEREERWQ